MPVSCVVVGCTMRANKRVQSLGVRFFRIPIKNKKNSLKRTLWINAINRKNWKPATWERVCSRHFHSGKPSNDPDNVDYRPTRFMKGDDDATVTASVSDSGDRSKRAVRRVEQSHARDVGEVKYNLEIIFIIVWC
jgi:hypothetical protein